MRFLVDECTGPKVAQWLRQKKHEVFSVYEQAPGTEDDVILEKALKEDWILITNDKDFGESVYREGHAHKGIILLRLQDERAVTKIETLRKLLDSHAEQLKDNFLVVTENKIRVGRPYNPT